MSKIEEARKMLRQRVLVRLSSEASNSQLDLNRIMWDADAYALAAAKAVLDYTGNETYGDYGWPHEPEHDMAWCCGYHWLEAEIQELGR